MSLTYCLYDARSALVAEGTVGELQMKLAPAETVECALALDAPKAEGKYTVKLTAVTEKGERVVELVDYEVK